MHMMFPDSPVTPACFEIQLNCYCLLDFLPAKSIYYMSNLFFKAFYWMKANLSVHTHTGYGD